MKEVLEMPDENQPIAITVERLLDLTNYIIDHMVNDAGAMSAR